MKHHYLKIFIVLFMFLTACGRVVLLEDLDLSNVNEIMVVLSKNGVRAEKKAISKQQETSWSIMVDRQDEDVAQQILIDHHLPKIKELGLSGVCKEAGLIPTPKTEKCRELLALKGEIINSLETIPGVVNADVVLNIPEREDFPDENIVANRPAASVVIEMSTNFQDQTLLTESMVQRFVANAVTGMDIRDVAVIISFGNQPVEEESFLVAPIQPDSPSKADADVPPEEPDFAAEEMVSVGGMKMLPDSAKKLKFLGIVLLASFLVLSVGLILVLMRLSRSRQSGLVPGMANMRQSLPEKQEMDQLVAQTESAEEDNN